MKAIVCTKYGSPEVLQIKNVEKPIPKDDEVLIKIFATAVTASDCIVRGFKVPLLMKIPMALAVGFPKPRNPILGQVLSGEIETTGKDVTRFKNGDQIIAFTYMRFGTYAEYTCLPEKSAIALKPSNLTYEEAAAIPYGGMLALYNLKKGNIQSGQNILIYGASGAIGTSAIQLAKYYGAKVTGVCSTANLEFVKSIGADTILDYTKDNLASNGELYDFIFDAVGKRKSSIFKIQCKQALAPNGKYISVDDETPKIQSEDIIEILTLLKVLVETGKIKPVIDRCYPLEQMVEAHRYVDKGHKKGNVVITVNQKK
jgi:NADPH:quinone reductase-like Zn-dependent oxidoreductase